MTETFESLISSYGYWAIFVGTFLEGETVLVISGFTVQRGYVDLPLVVLVAWMGSMVGDQFFPHGTLERKGVSGKKTALATPRRTGSPASGEVSRPSDHGVSIHVWAAGSYTFCHWHERNKDKSFFLLSAAGALVWSAVVATGGYLFGAVLEVIVDDVRRWALGVVVGILIGGIGVRVLRLLREQSSGVRLRESR